ncbi:MAG TPA: hypothetical protein VKB36_01050 [Vicinamibacterales bacterium]|nr:hypothetical protein [Vicinamibacterales bacterium]
MKFRIGLLLATGLAAAVVDSGAQAPAGARPARNTTKADVERTLPLTCVQAWTASGRQYPQMLATVIMLAKVSLANRNLTFPNTREAGEDAGKGIADDCKADPDALLFAIVDKHVRRVARAAP